MDHWLGIAFSRPVVRRGLKYAVVVGSVLVLINHGDTILAGQVSRTSYIKMVLTVVVPYCVSVLSSVGAILDTRRDGASPIAVTAENG